MLVPRRDGLIEILIADPIDGAFVAAPQLKRIHEKVTSNIS
jgi:hypothetical protein